MKLPLLISSLTLMLFLVSFNRYDTQTQINKKNNKDKKLKKLFKNLCIFINNLIEFDLGILKIRILSLQTCYKYILTDIL